MDEEIQLMEEMHQAGFSQEQVNKVITLKITLRDANKKWSKEELEELDSTLKTRWQAMINALSKDDIETAVTYFDKDMREIHKMLLSAATPDQRASILKYLQEIKLITVKGANCAEYKVRVPTTRNVYSYSRDVVFIRNDEGVWEIKSF